eukprot:TRINITY_DN15326_c0_g1_i3.p1 TRINITY_DN15326_c0_g1~~TRINITY_DN15326_c0_g1_i3.p1  ORF type:complete len:183 (-),score=43.28 TRINITY_DN15326_c0_g1_i3:152-700(-)
MGKQMDTSQSSIPRPTHKLSRDTVCPLCLWILTKPRACHHCFQSFCENCLFPWLRQTPNCPKCDGYVTTKILLDTTATVDGLLMEFAFAQLPDPDRRSREKLLRYIEALRKGKEEFQDVLLEKDEVKLEKTVQMKVEDYFTSLDDLEQQMKELLKAMNSTRKIAWKATTLKSKAEVNSLSFY